MYYRRNSDEDFRRLERAYQATPDDPEIIERIRTAAQRGDPGARRLLAGILRKQRASAMDPGWGPRRINRELLQFGNGEIYTWSDRQYTNGIWTDLVPDDVNNFRYGDLRPVDRREEPSHRHFLVPAWFTGSDYSGGSVNRSNYQSFLAEYGGLRGVKPVYGSFSSYGIAIQLNTFSPELMATLRGLENYPVIDEDAMSALEFEAQTEAWNNYYRRDFVRALQKKFAIEDLWDAVEPNDDAIDALFEVVREAANEYWSEESGGGQYINLDRIVEEMEVEDLEPLGITPETIFQWGWTHGLLEEFEEGIRAKFGIERPLRAETLEAIFRDAVVSQEDLSLESETDSIVTAVTTAILKRHGIDLDTGQLFLFEE